MVAIALGVVALLAAVPRASASSSPPAHQPTPLPANARLIAPQLLPSDSGEVAGAAAGTPAASDLERQLPDVPLTAQVDSLTAATRYALYLAGVDPGSARPFETITFAASCARARGMAGGRAYADAGGTWAGVVIVFPQSGGHGDTGISAFECAVHKSGALVGAVLGEDGRFAPPSFDPCLDVINFGDGRQRYFAYVAGSSGGVCTLLRGLYAQRYPVVTDLS